MTRRKLLRALGVAALGVPLASRAQQPKGGIHRLGYLGAVSAGEHQARVEAFRAGMRELGYIEGKNFVIEFRWADSNNARLPDLAGELVRLKVDLIVTHSSPGVRAARQATTTIPIVIGGTGDPVASGLVASLARPGGNVTGMSFFNPELAAKRLELLREAFPRIRRVAALVHPDNLGTMPAQEAAATTLKLDLELFRVRRPAEFEDAFEAMSKQRMEAVTIVEAPMLLANVGVAAGLSARHRIPAIGFSEVGEGGGLIGYGVNFPAMWHRAATFVDKILKGARPGDLPIDRATKFELVVNMKTARALGITIPQSILVRADRVIE